MKKSLIFGHLCLLILILLGLPSCRYITWVSESFNQGTKVCNKGKLMYQYVRSLHIYDEFDTVAHFDAIWLSDAVRRNFSHIYAEKQCFSEDRYKAFLRRQLEENKHYISFYVLAAIGGSAPLGDKKSAWGICLCIDGQEIQPREIKQIELDAEYKFFFGRTWSLFKVPYLVKFDARDINDERLIRPGTRSIALTFISVKRKDTMCWRLNAQAEVVQYPPNHPNTLAYDLYNH